jgi:hypothetical protein
MHLRGSSKATSTCSGSSFATSTTQAVTSSFATSNMRSSSEATAANLSGLQLQGNCKSIASRIVSGLQLPCNCKAIVIATELQWGGGVRRIEGAGDAGGIPPGRPATHIIFKIFRNSGFSKHATRFAGR